MTFYNPGDKTFETDVNLLLAVSKCVKAMWQYDDSGSSHFS